MNRSLHCRTIADHLLKHQLLPSHAVEAALLAEPESCARFGSWLVRHDWISEEAFSSALATLLKLPFRAGSLEADPALASVVDEQMARTAGVVPISLDGQRLQLGMIDPFDLDAVADATFRSGVRVDVVVVTPRALHGALDQIYGTEVARLAAQFEAPEARDETLEAAAEIHAAPVVRLVDHLIREAVAAGASDLHIETNDGHLRVRQRVDGLLHEQHDLPAGLRDLVISRVKVMAGMDIAVRRRPQDGGMSLTYQGRQLALRVSTLPADRGEKVVVRIVDPTHTPQQLDDLGISAIDARRLRRLIERRHGVILVAGPTGSGKSSTLQAVLREIDRVRLNVVTLEDPVEYRIEGVSHVQVSPRAGLGFPEGLRAILRQDPDVIMVGEIRDRETAEIAMTAAITGHLVLSTVHTIDAPGAVTRLLHMGVPAHLVAGGLSGVVAQRLLRRVCRRCRARSASDCTACHGGFRGRTGVFQVLEADHRLREVVAQGGAQSDVRRAARENGMGSLRDDAQRLVAEGVTTALEAERVLRIELDAGLTCLNCKCDMPRLASGCPACGAPVFTTCVCGTRVERHWRWCAHCLRPLTKHLAQTASRAGP